MATIKEQMQEALAKAQAVNQRAIDEKRDPPDAETAEIATHVKAYQELKPKLAAEKSAAQVQADLDAIGLELGLERTPDGPKARPDSFQAPRKFETIGETFVKSEAYAQLMAQFKSGHIGREARIASAPVGYKALVTGASSTSGGAFVLNDREADFELLGRRPLTIRSLVSNRQTTSDTIEYVRQTSTMSSAAVVAEATSSAAPTTGASSGAALTLATGGGYKPEGSFALEIVTATVRTIAEWVPATKRSLADASQLRGLIDQELRDDLAEEEEDQILNGNGSGENFTGILSTSGIQTQAYSATVTDLDPLIETTLKGKTKVRTTGRSIPTGYVLNPADFEKIQLARLAKNPANEATAGAVPTLHGLPVVESEAIAAGVGLVGDFRKAVIWDREQASITATDSHADFFIRNLVAILAEERLAFGVRRPAAFCTLDLTA
jgi:HK97 family phage major capsid protein